MKIMPLTKLLTVVALLLSCIFVQQAHAQSWSAMTSDTNADLQAVWGSSGSDVFAAGTLSGEGIVLHYNGAAWSAMTIGRTASLYGIWGSSSSDVFAAGVDGTILHYNGTAWSAMTSNTYSKLYCIWGSSGSDVFAVGESGTIMHYNGSSWSAMTSNISEYLYGIWGSSGSNVFAVGGSGKIQRYNGTAWSAMTSNTTNSLYSICGNSGSNVFAAGLGGVIMRYNGTAWSAMTSNINETLFGIWGSSASDVFAVSYAGKIQHYNGTAWSAQTSPTAQGLNGIWGSSGTNVFAVGNGGAIRHYASASSTTTTAAGTTTTAASTTTTTAASTTTSTAASTTTTTAVSTTTTAGSTTTTIDDYGDSCATAHAVALNTTVDGQINSTTDFDFFSFDIPSAGTLTVYTTGTLDTQGSLKDSACIQIAYNDDIDIHANYNFSITQSVTTGTYYLSVNAYNTATGPYTLYVEFTPDGATTTTTVAITTTIEASTTTTIIDDYGDSCGAAHAVTLNTTVEGQIDSTTDFDFFSFDIPSAGTLTVYTTGTLDTQGSLKNSSCTEIAYSDDIETGVNNNFSITQSVTTGPYYVSVNAYAGLTGAYMLHVEFTPDVTTTTTAGSTTTTTVASTTTTAPASTTTTAVSTTTTTTVKRCPFKRGAATDAAVQPLRSLRDSQLDTAIGAVIASMYYQNMDEIADILQDSRSMRVRFNRLTRGNMPVVGKLLRQGTATIEADDLLEMHEFLTDLQGKSGLKLCMDIDFILRGLESGWLLQWLGVSVE